MATVFEPIRPVPPMTTMTTIFMVYPPLSMTAAPIITAHLPIFPTIRRNRGQARTSDSLR
jgi:hypothetical protein